MAAPYGVYRGFCGYRYFFAQQRSRHCDKYLPGEYFPTLLQALDFLFGRAGFKIFPFWIGEKLSSVTSLPLPSGVLLAGIITAIIYVIAANVIGIYLFKRYDVK